MKDVESGDLMTLKHNDGSVLKWLEVSWIDDKGGPVLQIPLAEFSDLRYLEADGWRVTAHVRPSPNPKAAE